MESDSENKLVGAIVATILEMRLEYPKILKDLSEKLKDNNYIISSHFWNIGSRNIRIRITNILRATLNS